MDETPWIALNPAGFWVCVGCGAENYCKFPAIENPDNHPGGPHDGDVALMPRFVTCISCEKKFSTQVPETRPHPKEYLDDLRDLIDALAHGKKGQRKRALEFLAEHHNTFIAALSWALENVHDNDGSEEDDE